MINFFKMKTVFLSIKMKFTLVTILVSLVSFGGAAALSTRWLAEEIEDDYKEKATLMGTHIIHDLEEAMLRRVHGDIYSTLDIYRSYKDVEEVRVFNSRGKEVFAKEEGPPDGRVEEAIRTGDPLTFYKKLKNRDVTTFVIPIRNKTECHACHEKSESLRGALLLSLNLEAMKHYVGKQTKKFLILFAILAAAIVAMTLLAVNELFLKPLSLIQNGTEAIGRGEFQHQIPVQSKDEIGALADNFNRMAQTLHTKNEMLWEQVRLLSRSQKEWHETFDSITDLIAVIDKDFNITRANRAFYEYISISPDTEIAKKCYDLLGTCVRPNCPHLLSMGSKKHINNEVLDGKTGKVLDVSYFPYYSPEGDFFGTIFIAKDITERKENEMTLIMSERLAALGQIASGIAHEINNPMATVAVCAEGLLKRVRNSQYDLPLFENYLKIIEEEVNRCKHITNSMLSFVRKTSPSKQDVDLHETLDRTLEMISFQGRLNEVEVLKNYPKESLVIHGNEGELRQVFLSIIVNALDAMEDKGALTLETGIIPSDPPSEKSGRLETEGSKGGFVFINICDTGPGVPSDLVDRIFDPFFTTRSEKGGTGLGLSIAKKILNKMNGRIEVSSEKGNGTTFRIILPI